MSDRINEIHNEHFSKNDDDKKRLIRFKNAVKFIKSQIEGENKTEPKGNESQLSIKHFVFVMFFLFCVFVIYKIQENHIGIGNKVQITEHCYGAISEYYINEMERFLKAKDTIGIYDLTSGNSIAELSNNDTGLVISKHKYLEVRLLSGNHYSEKPYVNKKVCKRIAE
jgi:hypothetical protein